VILSCASDRDFFLGFKEQRARGIDFLQKISFFMEDV
jgi:hypothetical protein